MSEQLNSTALHDLAGSVHDIANRRAGVMSTYEVANLELAHEQLNRFAASTERPVPTTDMTAMSHESTGFCFCGQIHGRIDAWNEHDWAALREYMPAVHPAPNPSLPTREQIADRLIERLRNSGGWPVDEVWQRWQNLFTEYDRDIALFSQPTPSAEPKPLNPDAIQRVLDYHGWPPRVADMAPGTTFTARFRAPDDAEEDHFTVMDDLWVRASNTRWSVQNAIDPSTVRDVTPPKEPTA